MIKYYLYRHIRFDKNIPFYIGIGHNKNGNDKYQRANWIYRKNSIWKRIVSKTNYGIEVVIDDLSLEDALIKEKEFIKMYGRINNNTGILANLTDGGEGTSGIIRSDEFKEKQRQLKIGIKVSDETKEKMRISHLLNKESINKLIERNKILKSKPLTENHKNKIRNSHMGLRASDKTKKLMSEIRSKKPILQFNLNGEFIREWKSIAEINTVLGYDNSNISRACSEKETIIRKRNRRTAYNYIWKYKMSI